MKKKTKFSLGMKIVTLLTVITMASVGFAAWVITAPVTAAEAEGSIKVENVVDNGAPIIVTAAICDSTGANTYEKPAAPIDPNSNYAKKSTFVFGYADFSDYSDQVGTEATDHQWLSQPEIGKENLTVFLKVTVKNNRDSAATKGVTVTFMPSDPTKFETGITKNSYLAPTISGNGLETATYNSSDDSIVLTIPAGKIPEDKDADAYEVVLAISFEWGSAFGNINPYVYYNQSEHSQTLANKAVTALTDLFNATTGVSYTVVVDQAK